MRADVMARWYAWRLVLSGAGFTYGDVFCRMTPAELEDANVALDILLEGRR